MLFACKPLTAVNVDDTAGGAKVWDISSADNAREHLAGFRIQNNGSAPAVVSVYIGTVAAGTKIGDYDVPLVADVDLVASSVDVWFPHPIMVWADVYAIADTDGDVDVIVYPVTERWA